ncbi:MAG: hypothetical protein ACRCY5_05345 [Phocaeicola sp.]
MITEILTNSIAVINARCKELSTLSNDELRASYIAIKQKAIEESLQKRSVKEILDDALIEVFAIFKETARRFAEEEEIIVTANDLDNHMAKQCDFIKEYKDESKGYQCSNEPCKIVYCNHWEAAGVSFTWNIIPYDEQLMGGIGLHYGTVIQMATGEGKTFVSIPAILLNTLLGNSVHVMTVNSYLSKRDYEFTRPIYIFLGLTVSCIEELGTYSKSKKNAYLSDVVFGTNANFGFDYLFDHIASTSESCVQNKFNFAILDEADSILIDEASTPLISSSYSSNNDGIQKELNENLYSKLLPIVQKLLDVDREQFCTINQIKYQADYTAAGKQWITKELNEETLFDTELFSRMTRTLEENNSLSDEERKGLIESERNKHYHRKEIRNILQQLLKALTLYTKDVDYILVEDKKEDEKSYKAVIIDSHTGRTKESCRWQYGAHEAVEAKEKIQIKKRGEMSGTISIKNYLQLYDKLAGMTGTSLSCEEELRRTYGVSVLKIPTHCPICREDHPLRVFRTRKDKLDAITAEIKSIHKTGRPILIGVKSVQQSEEVMERFKQEGVEAMLLNAKALTEESSIISMAGQSGKITVATSIAGRGTDIKPDTDALAAGGLAVIGVDIAHSDRIDKQLKGRAGRQGNPGSSQFYVSLEDDVLHFLTNEEREQLNFVVANLNDEQTEITTEETKHWFYVAQQNRMKEDEQLRSQMNQEDDTIKEWREQLYGIRMGLLKGVKKSEEALRFLIPITEHSFWNSYECHKIELLQTILPTIAHYASDSYLFRKNGYVPLSDGKEVYSIKCNYDEAIKSQGKSFVIELESQILISTIDKYWIRFINDINVSYADTDFIMSRYEKIHTQIIDKTKHLLITLFPPNYNPKEEHDSYIETGKRLNYLKKEEEVAELLELCPCGSEKPLILCHRKSSVLKL